LSRARSAPATGPAAAIGTLRFLLGHALCRGIASLRDLDPDNDVVLVAEVTGEHACVHHHVKKRA
jgi:deoxyribodipyrimidine photolyase-related protein